MTIALVASVAALLVTALSARASAGTIPVNSPWKIRSAVTIFVSTSGDNNNDGSAPEQAVRDIQVAVESSEPGDTISVAPGSYRPFSIESRSRLSIFADAGTIVSDGAYDSRAAVAIDGSTDILISGFNLTHSLWGVDVQNSREIDLLGLTISDVGQEGIHVRRYSSDITIADSSITLTGQRGGEYANYGEGIYLGTGHGITDDDTNNIRILRNNISHTTSEAIDVKASVYDVLIEKNRIHNLETNTSGAVVVGIGERSYRDPNVLIRGNLIWNISTNTQWTDGNALTLSAATTVEANVIWSTEHHGILMDNNFVSQARQVILRSNAVFDTGNAAIGLWNNDETQSANPVLDQNLTGNEVASSYGVLPTSTGTSPDQLLVNLRDDLLVSLSGSGIASASPPTSSTPTTSVHPTTPTTGIASTIPETSIAIQQGDTTSSHPTTTIPRVARPSSSQTLHVTTITAPTSAVIEPVPVVTAAARLIVPKLIQPVIPTSLPGSDILRDSIPTTGASLSTIEDKPPERLSFVVEDRIEPAPNKRVRTGKSTALKLAGLSAVSLGGVCLWLDRIRAGATTNDHSLQC